MVKSACLRGASVLAVAASLWTSNAFAADATATAAASGAETGPLAAELIVVAQKREQKIETVPVAITAFSAKQREIIGIKTVQDLSDFTPGLSYYNSNDRAYIRGIGRNTVNLAIASGVATYYNGIYYGANATIALAHDSLFIGNIEVDRGPQNTLHGSNADGGVINYISAKPTKDFYAEGRVGIGNDGLYYGEAVVSGPINQNWRFRLGGSYDRETGGYFKNLDGPPQSGSGPQGGNGDWHYEEGQIEGTIGDHLDVWAIADSAEYVSSFHTVASVGAIPDFAFGSDSPLAPGPMFGLCSFPGAPAAQCNAGVNGGQTVVPGSAIAFPVTANQFPGNNPSTANPHTFIQGTTGHNTQNDDVALATQWTYHFPGMDLTYLGGYQSFYYHLTLESQPYDAGLKSYQVNGNQGGPLVAAAVCAATPFLAPGPACIAGVQSPLTISPLNSHILFIEKDQYSSHELTLTSTGKSPLQWLLGGYYYHEHFDQPVSAFCLPNQPQVFAPVGAPPNPGGCLFNTDGNISYIDVAGFAHASYKFNQQWEIAGGLRYTTDHRYGYELQRVLLFDLPGFGADTFGALTPAIDITGAPAAGAPGTKGVPFVNAAGFAQRSLDFNWSGVTGDATVDWTPDPTTLAYFRYARGYKAGGFNAGSLAANPTTQSEYVDDFEIGLKKTIGSIFELNGAIFYYNFFNDQQPFTVTLASGAMVSEIFNIPESRIDGVELEGVWKPIDPMTLSLQYSYLDAVVTNMAGACVTDSNDPFAVLPGANTTGCAHGGENITGAHLPETPPNKVSFNGQYAFHFDAGTLVFSGTYVWKDKTFGEIFNRADNLAPAYSTVNLRATFDDAKGRYTITAFVDNVFNTLGYDNVTETNVGLPPGSALDPVVLRSDRGLTAPLTFGAEFQVRFR